MLFTVVDVVECSINLHNQDVLDCFYYCAWVGYVLCDGEVKTSDDFKSAHIHSFMLSYIHACLHTHTHTIKSTVMVVVTVTIGDDWFLAGGEGSSDSVMFVGHPIDQSVFGKAVSE